MSWLLLVVFVIIWAAFLIPSWRRSPTSTVEDFEQKMSLLAEAHRASPGRWVLVPRKGHRFLGPQDRQRARMRRRRRFVFVALLEVTALTFLMGLFQPLRPMWVLTVALVAALVVYVGMLLRLRAVEMARAESRRAMLEVQRQGIGLGVAYATNGGPSPGSPYVAHGGAVRDGNGRGFTGNGYRNGNGHGNGYGNGNGRGNGHDSLDFLDDRDLPAARYLQDGGIQIMDEDVHVIVRRSDEVDLQALRASNGASAD